MTYVFAANTGFLWKERPFTERIANAAAAGFDALEFHDEVQRSDPDAVKSAIKAAGLPVLGLNIRMGDTAGTAACPGTEAQFTKDLAAAITAADLVGAPSIHVLSGFAAGAEAQATFVANLTTACAQWSGTILIEPICHAKMPGYFLHDIHLAAQVIDAVGAPNLKIMFDVFHIETEHGRAAALFSTYRDLIGHVQIANVPDRAEPVGGTLDIPALCQDMRDQGYTGAFGCEYAPTTTVEEGLGWRAAYHD